MLDYSPENLLREAQAAEAHAKKHLASFNDMIQTFVGSYYREDMRPANPSPENYPYSYIANVRPRLVFNNPRFNASTESSAIDAHKLITQAKFVNRWALRENLAKKLNPFVTMGLLMRSVMLTTFEDDVDDGNLPEGELKRKMPHCYIIENHRYFRDPVSTPAVEPRFKGHVWVRDLDDVKKMKGVNKAAVESLIPDVELRKLDRPNANSGNTSEMPARFEVIAYEIWVRECNDFRSDRGHNGTIFTIAIGQKISADGSKKRLGKPGYLLPPRPYYGPKWGPYTELEFIDVPGQTYGTSPVSVVMQQVEELNAHLSATADAAARMKHLIFIDAANDTLMSAVQNSPDGSVLGIPNVTKDQVIPVVIGGPAPEQYQYNETVRARLDRNIGMDAAQRGGQEQSKTATATNVQYESLNIRMADLKRIAAAAVKQIANTVCWYAWESNNVVMRMTRQDALDVGIEPKGVTDFYGGPQEGEQLPPWEEAAIDLEPYSMEAVDEDKLAQETHEALALIVELAQMMSEAPWIGYDVILEQLGKLRKFDWLHECINGQLFAEFMKEKVQQSLEQHQAEQAMTQAQIEQMNVDNALKKAQLMAALKQMQQGGEEQQEKMPFAANYKDLPEDKKRDAETMMFGSPSTQPLTSPAHISNALDVHKTKAGMMHERSQQATQQKHDAFKQKSQQGHQLKQTRLSGMLRDMATRSGNRKGMGSRTARAQKGPTNTASRGAKAFARTSQ